MRELTFKGYLEQQLCEMSGYKSKSLYKFAKSSADNARLKNVLCLYLNNYANDSLKIKIRKKYPAIADECKKTEYKSAESFDDSLSDYKTIYENYLYKRDLKKSENKIIRLMQKQITLAKQEKGISNYRIYKSLNLNPGNINAFLTNGDVTKVGLNTARTILAFVRDCR